MSIKIEDIVKLFEDEFMFVKDKFAVVKLLSDGADEKRELEREAVRTIDIPNICCPGVYVFYGNGSAYKVGRHFQNTRLRVMQHLDDKTGNGKYNVVDLAKYKDREVILFNLKKPEDAHWAAALEVYLENELRQMGLKIRSKRQG